MEKLLIRGGRVIDPANGMDKIADVLIEDGKIAAIGERLSADGAKVYDAAGKVVAPGFIDMHCHLRRRVALPRCAKQHLRLDGDGRERHALCTADAHPHAH